MPTLQLRRTLTMATFYPESLVLQAMQQLYFSISHRASSTNTPEASVAQLLPLLPQCGLSRTILSRIMPQCPRHRQHLYYVVEVDEGCKHTCKVMNAGRQCVPTTTSAQNPFELHRRLDASTRTCDQTFFDEKKNVILKENSVKPLEIGLCRQLSRNEYS